MRASGQFNSRGAIAAIVSDPCPRTTAPVILPRSALLAALTVGAATASAQPTLTDPGLRVSTVVTGVLAAHRHRVPRRQRLPRHREGERPRAARDQRRLTGTVLDLAVNSNSERGLLGIALDPEFPGVPNVYLFWTESLTGADSTVVSDVPCSPTVSIGSCGTGPR